MHLCKHALKSRCSSECLTAVILPKDAEAWDTGQAHAPVLKPLAVGAKPAFRPPCALQVYQALFALATRDFPRAATLFLDSIATFTTYASSHASSRTSQPQLL